MARTNGAVAPNACGTGDAGTWPGTSGFYSLRVGDCDFSGAGGSSRARGTSFVSSCSLSSSGKIFSALSMQLRDDTEVAWDGD